MTVRKRWRVAMATAVVAAGFAAVPSAALSAEPAPPPPSVLNSGLFYQLLIGEIELQRGQVGNAYELYLDAARRTRDDQLFRRAVEIALQGRAGDLPPAVRACFRYAIVELDAVQQHLLLFLAAALLDPLVHLDDATQLQGIDGDAGGLVARLGELSLDDVGRLDAAGGTAVFVRRRTDAGRGGEPVFVPQLGDAEFTAQRFAPLGAVNLGFGGYLLVADEGAELGADGFPTAGAPFSLFLVFMGALYRVATMTPVPVEVNLLDNQILVRYYEREWSRVE